MDNFKNNDFVEKMKSVIEEYAFLEDEVKRCYHDMEKYEAKIDDLEKQKMNLVEALARKTWQEMEQTAFKLKQTRKWPAHFIRKG
ncbi:hypothetical protein RN86_10055 [Streptococcus gordonii]|uniref:hypothetical protein n=1 Tax=Streptococcus gordonii TaxID=1302 RepID=UPI0006B24824|nr:hypothetical protein [Streptococcus gordonii]ALD72735.1 hypothetical protein RN86_10055 [Streptococcus gordonii]QBX25190.1 hypothetical protein Javan242_0034 [Streptococcus phage Javan242]